MLTLAPLPYSYDALEPVISARSVQLHHDVLEARYVTGFNSLLRKHPMLEKYGSLARLFLNLDEVRQKLGDRVARDVEFYGGGAANHEFYWSVTDPSESVPSAGLTQALQQGFGGLGEMLGQLRQISQAIRGSGWGWLVYDLDTRDLRVSVTGNQSSPLVYRQYPVIGVDVWEHAYYLDYPAGRAEYLERWSHLINWQFASESYRNAAEFT